MAAPSIADLLSRTIAGLDAAGVHDEVLAVWKRSRGLLGIGASDSLVPVGRAWRLGAYLLARDGALYSTGEVTRAIEPGRAAVNRSAAGEQRRAIRSVAARSGFPRGEVINYGWSPIDPTTLELGPLEAYLNDRVTLLRGE